MIRIHMAGLFLAALMVAQAAQAGQPKKPADKKGAPAANVKTDEVKLGITGMT